MAQENNSAIVETQHINQTGMEPHQFMSILIGTVAARKNDRRLVITQAELERFIANFDGVDISTDMLNNQYIITAVGPVEG